MKTNNKVKTEVAISENQLRELLEFAKKDKKSLLNLKNTAVMCERYELASQLREIETNLFPETKEDKMAKYVAHELSSVLRLVNLEVPDKVCYLIMETIKVYNKKKTSITIKDASKILANEKKIFGGE
jgi:hypothetical protein